MTTILIPNNTSNSISKVAEHANQFRKTFLFLGSLEATPPHLLA